MQSPPYNEAQLKVDKEFVLKKLGITEKEFNELMDKPVRSHWEFDTEGSFFNYYPVFKPVRPIWRKIKSLTS